MFNERLVDVSEESSKCEKRLCPAGQKPKDFSMKAHIKMWLKYWAIIGGGQIMLWPIHPDIFEERGEVQSPRGSYAYVIRLT